MNWSELNLSDDTVKLFKDLIERKEKWNILKISLLFYCMITAVLCLFFARAFYENIMLGSGGNAMAMFGILLSNKKVTLLFLGSMAMVMLTRNEVNKVEKAKKKFENLRLETIDKLEYSWMINLNSETRDQLSSFMKTEYDINLRYKS